MQDFNNFYLLVSKHKYDKTNKVFCELSFSLGNNKCVCAVPWSIKKIHVENKNATNKFNNFVQAIKKKKSIPGYSEVLWMVSYLSWVRVLHQALFQPNMVTFGTKSLHNN